MPTFELTFKPGVTAQVDVDADNLLFYAAHQETGPVPDQIRVIRDALDHPIGTSRLEALLDPRQSVVIVVDDVTRPTPAARILPFLLEQVHRAGVPTERVLIFMALGTHRPMTEEELRAKLGDEVCGRYRVANRDHREGPFVDLGHTPSGTPIEVNREVVEAHFKIAVGNVVPHISAGWGGGSKIVLPGVCSQKTSDMMHLMACVVQPVLEVLGTRDNKPRTEMDAVAARLGLDFIVNTVMDEGKNLLGVFAGHFVEAHRAACRMAEKVMVIPIPAPADILVVSANPCHFDYWQGIKPYAYAHRAVRQGGVIVFLLDGSEGLCGDAPSHEATVRKYLSWSFEDQRAAVERGEVQDLVGLNVPMYHATLRGHVERTILVTPHMPPEDIAALSFHSAPDAQTALEQAYRLIGRDARVGIIPFGGETLVRVKEQNGHLPGR